MFLTAEKEDDIELTDLGYIQPARLPQKLHGNHNTLSNADQLTRHHLSRGHHSSQTGLVGPHSAEYYDTVSLRLGQLRRDGDAAVSGRLELPPTQHRSSNNVNSYFILNTPSTLSPGGIDRTNQPFSITSNQTSRVSDQPQFLAGEILPHTGKGKGRIPNVEQKPGAKRDLSDCQEPIDVQESVVERDLSIDRSEHPYNPLQHPRLDRSLLASSQHGKDTQLERRQYRPKRFKHLQDEAGDICTAVRPDECRVHGKSSKKGASTLRYEGRAGRDLGHDASTNWFLVDESAENCGAAYERSGLPKRHQNRQLTDVREIGAVWALVRV